MLPWNEKFASGYGTDRETFLKGKTFFLKDNISRKTLDGASTINQFFQCELFSLYENSENLMCVIQYQKIPNSISKGELALKQLQL